MKDGTLQQYAGDTAASLADVTTGHSFNPHLEMRKVHEKLFLILTLDDPDLRIGRYLDDPEACGIPCPEVPAVSTRKVSHD